MGGPATREKAWDGVTKSLEPRATQVLVVVTRAKGAVISREELIERCWGERIVGDKLPYPDRLNRSRITFSINAIGSIAILHCETGPPINAMPNLRSEWSSHRCDLEYSEAAECQAQHT